jgi:hypothetical protein
MRFGGRGRRRDFDAPGSGAPDVSQCKKTDYEKSAHPSVHATTAQFRLAIGERGVPAETPQLPEASRVWRGDERQRGWRTSGAIRLEVASMRRTAIAFLVLVLSIGGTVAQDLWLHIHVRDFEDDDATININMPLSAIRSFLSHSDAHHLRDGKIHLGDHAEIDGIDLREILTALRDAPDSEFITIRSREESVRVAKEDGVLLMNIDESDGERVRIRVPMEVVDILLEGEGEEIDVDRMLEALEYLDGTEILTVDSDDSQVRIWIGPRDSGGY